MKEFNTGTCPDLPNIISGKVFKIFDAFDFKRDRFEKFKNVENKKAHFKQINVELEQTANQLIAKINEL